MKPLRTLKIYATHVEKRYSSTVIPKLCAAAHSCAATDSQVCREAFWNFGKELYMY